MENNCVSELSSPPVGIAAGEKEKMNQDGKTKDLTFALIAMIDRAEMTHPHFEKGAGLVALNVARDVLEHYHITRHPYIIETTGKEEK